MSEYWPFHVACDSDHAIAWAMSLVQTSNVGLIAWVPLMKSVFFRWRVDSVPVTFEGRASTEKRSGVLCVPLYRRSASARSAADVDGGWLTGGFGTDCGVDTDADTPP